MSSEFHRLPNPVNLVNAACQSATAKERRCIGSVRQSTTMRDGCEGSTRRRFQRVLHHGRSSLLRAAHDTRP